MGKDKDKVSGPIMGITDGDICHPVLLTPEGEVIMHREKEMLERIEKMEGQVKSWVDGLLDLNERMRRLSGQLDLEIARVTNLELKVKMIPGPLEDRIERLQVGWANALESARRDLGERITKLGASIEALMLDSQNIHDALKNTREYYHKEGGWDVPGTENA